MVKTIAELNSMHLGELAEYCKDQKATMVCNDGKIIAAIYPTHNI